MDMQRRTYCEDAMALADAEGCTPECRQRLLNVVDCSLGLYYQGECLGIEDIFALGGVCERVIHVGPGAEFADPQDAFDSIVDAAVDNQYVVVLCPGIYTGNYVMPDYVHLEAKTRHRGACRMQSAVGVTLTVPVGSGCRIEGVTIETTGQAALDFPAATAGKHYHISDCRIRGDYNTDNENLVTIQGDACCVTFLNGTRFEYYETGDTGAANWHRAVYVTATSEVHFHNCIWRMEFDDPNGIMVGIDAAATYAVEWVIQGCEAHMHADNLLFAGAVGFLYDHGVGVEKHVETNHIHLISTKAGLGYGVFLDSSDNAGLLHATANHIEVVGFAGNFSYHAGNGDQICSASDFLNCAQGTSTAGTGVVDLVSSEACGELSVTENAWIGGTPAGVPAANTLYRDNIVKGWIQLNGTGVIAINDSFNVSGIVDGGVGLYTVTWDQDFANANYSCVATTDNYHAVVDTFAVGSVRVSALDAGHNYVDTTKVCAVAIGDQ